MHPILYTVLRSLYLAKRALAHLKVMDFSVIPGRVAWICWRLGIVGFWHRNLVRRFKRAKPIASEPKSAAALEVLGTPPRPPTHPSGEPHAQRTPSWSTPFDS